MKNLNNAFGLFFLLALFASCGKGQTEANKSNVESTPKALQESEREISSYKSSSDLTEELYQEIVDKTPSLKKLEEDIDAFNSKPNAFFDNFNQYDSKSKNYYGSVNNKASAITDSLLKSKIQSLIALSSKKYANKCVELNSLINQISTNSVSLNDRHNALKIILTMPIIEKYQDDNKPDKKEFKNLIKEQENLIIQTEKATPKIK
ncbi:MAG: hypothetical protein WCK02_01300 [Bacteroidota bacterium]